MKKETYISIFYFLYFTWLFSITYLTTRENFLNYYTVFVAIFYFLFLRERSDIFWFIAASVGYFLYTGISITDGRLIYDYAMLLLTPVWLPVAWGITIVALRKFYLIVSK